MLFANSNSSSLFDCCRLALVTARVQLRPTDTRLPLSANFSFVVPSTNWRRSALGSFVLLCSADCTARLLRATVPEESVERIAPAPVGSQLIVGALVILDLRHSCRKLAPFLYHCTNTITAASTLQRTRQRALCHLTGLRRCSVECPSPSISLLPRFQSRLAQRLSRALPQHSELPRVSLPPA